MSHGVITRLKRGIAASPTARGIADRIWPVGRPVLVRDGQLRGTRLMVPVFSGGANYAAGGYEQTEVDILLKIVAAANIQVFCDVGAHIGYYSILVDRLTEGNCSIYAFEPSPTSFTCLAHNLAHYCRGELRLHCEAVGEAAGTAEFAGRPGQVADGLCDYRPPHYGRAESDRSMVRVTTLDDALAVHDSGASILAKVDVEGAEAAVLRGASALTDNARPFWLIECHTRELLDEVLGELSTRSYLTYLLSGEGAYFLRLLATPEECAAQSSSVVDWAIESQLMQPTA